MTENKPTTIVIILIVLVMLAGVGLMYSVSQQQKLAQEQAAQQAEKPTDAKADSEDKQSVEGEVKIDVDKAKEAAKNSTKDTPIINVSKEEASKIATDEYGGVVTSVEDDYYQGSFTWEVEITDSSQGKIEVEVDKKTGEIVSMEKD